MMVSSLVFDCRFGLLGGGVRSIGEQWWRALISFPLGALFGIKKFFFEERENRMSLSRGLAIVMLWSHVYGTGMEDELTESRVTNCD